MCAFSVKASVAVKVNSGTIAVTVKAELTRAARSNQILKTSLTKIVFERAVHVKH